MFQNLMVQFLLYYLSSGCLRELKSKRKFQTFSSRSGPLQERVVQYTQLESIRLWYLRFDRIVTNRFPWCRFVYTGSRFARDLENLASRVYAGWVENVVDSTRFDRIVTNRFLLCRFVIPEVDLRET